MRSSPLGARRSRYTAAWVAPLPWRVSRPQAPPSRFGRFLGDRTSLLRDFREEDISQVVDLHGRVFGPSPFFSRSALGEYVEEVLFRNPWRDESLPSLISLDGKGCITGFLGVLPRPMVFRGQPIRAAVCTQLMVDMAHRHDMTAIRLMKTFLSGPQELSIGDGANDQARRLLMGLGGDTALLYSMHWTRPLRPARLLLSIMEGRPALRPMMLGALPAGALIDAVAARMRPNRFHRQNSGLEDVPLTPSAMLAHLPDMFHGNTLLPLYDAQSLAWLLDQAAQKTRHGQFRSRAVIDGKKGLIGWYLYYLQPGAVSEVIQVAAAKAAFGCVFQQLLNDAWREGAVALRGRLDPRHIQELSDRHCWLRRDGTWTLIHSRHPEISAAIHQGEAFLSRLDAEWWMRFQG